MLFKFDFLVLEDLGSEKFKKGFGMRLCGILPSVIGFLLFASSLHADWLRDPTAITVLSTEDSDGPVPSVAVNDSGKAFILWSSYQLATSSYAIKASLYDARQEIWGDPSTLSIEGVTSLFPRIAIDGSGNALALWVSYGAESTLYASRYDATTQSWQQTGNGAVVISQSSSGPSEVQVAMDGSGYGWVAWQEDQDGYEAVFASRYDPSTHTWSTAHRISPESAIVNDFSLAVASSGKVVVAFSESVSGGGVIKAAYYDGTSWQYSQDSAPSLSEAGGNATGAQVAINDAGESVAIWNRFNGSVNVAQAAHGQAGTWSHTGSEAYNLSNTNNSTGAPYVGIDNEGRAIAVWTEYSSINSLYSSFYNPTTSSWLTTGEEAILLSPASNPVNNSSFSMSSDGKAIATWVTTVTDISTGNDISVLVLATADTEDGFWENTGDDFVQASENSAQYPTSTLNNSGVVVCVWSENASVKSRVYGAGPWVEPVSMLEAKLLQNRFLAQRYYYYQLTWQASSSDSVTYYEIYRDGVLVATIFSGDNLIYYDKGVLPTQSITYSVKAFDSIGTESEAVDVSVP